MSPHQARAEIAARGLRMDPFGRSGFRVHGHMVDVLVADLRFLHESDLRPIPAQGAGAPGLRERRIQISR